MVAAPSETAGPARVGMLTPSSNTVLEPYTSQIFAAFGDAASVHFARFPVTEISMSERSQRQFDIAPILEAARRLADARVDVIAWNGTSAAWLGLDSDVALCAAIEKATGVRATSTMLAYEEALRLLGARRVALVTPYLSEIQDRIIANYAARGVEVVADRRLEDRGNFSFAQYGVTRIADLTREAVAPQAGGARPDAALIICTNFRGAPVAQAIEEETGVPVLDSVAVTAWRTLATAGLDPARVTGWGGVFGLRAASNP